MEGSRVGGSTAPRWAHALSILSFTEKVHALVRKLGSDSVKAHHLQRLHIRRFLTAVFSLARFIYRLGPRGLHTCAHVKYENKN